MKTPEQLRAWRNRKRNNAYMWASNYERTTSYSVPEPHVVVFQSVSPASSRPEKSDSGSRGGLSAPKLWSWLKGLVSKQ